MIGSRLGPWILDRELGRGGMGTVYAAHADPPPADGSDQAAIKVLATELAVDTGFRQRFQREIDILRQLDHPNIVRFLGSGEDQGRFYFAMELIDGPSVEASVLDRGKLPWPEVLDIAIQVALALRHAHDRGVVHRDIKPSNLLRSPDADAERPFGIVKLSDFGIASLFASPHLTVAGGVVGTAEYLSPEQAAGKRATKRSDLYSLGVLLYLLVTGRTPFRGDVPTLLQQHMFGQFDRPLRIVPDLPPDLDAIIRELLEKDPDRRPGDAASLHRRLESLRRKMERIASDPNGSALLAVADKGREGPATLMSRLMRAELDRENRGGPVQQFFNRPPVIVVLFCLTLGLLIWTFWPASAASMYSKGAALMASADPDDWAMGWERFLEPMEKRFPDHPYGEQMAEFKERYDRYEALRKSETRARFAGPMSDAQWFYHEGMRLRQKGDEPAARRVWKQLITGFEGVPAEYPWVKLAQDEMAKVDTAGSGTQRLESLRQALAKAAQLREAGKTREADEVITALRDLYRDDPAALKLMPGK